MNEVVNILFWTTISLVIANCITAVCLVFIGTPLAKKRSKSFSKVGFVCFLLFSITMYFKITGL